MHDKTLICQLIVKFMTPKGYMPLALFLLPGRVEAQAPYPSLESVSVSQQMVVVTTKDWEGSDGVMQRFERKEHGWQAAGPALPVVVGRGGLGWGRGWHPLPQPGPQKKEGDGRSPAGIYHLSYAFGYAPPDAVRAIKLPYVQCIQTLECVDDTNSTSYNIIVDRRSVKEPDWKSSEKMLMSDDEYRLGVFVEQNSFPSVPGAGSCVFMHIWKGPGKATSGCTAMSLGAMESLLAWLDPQYNPILVQLPQTEYQRRQKEWRLPRMELSNAPPATQKDR